MIRKHLDLMTPKEIVQELDSYIVGQERAKKMVAIALRNRVRRKCLPAELREEIAPKNIIMIGPTGVGKTEIARRLSRLCGAPFIKVEATKYTEVGYVGRDVESMVRDLMGIAMNMVKAELAQTMGDQASQATEEQLLDYLLPRESKDGRILSRSPESREKMRERLRSGSMEKRKIEIEITSKRAKSNIEIFTGPNIEDLQNAMKDLGSLFGGKSKKKKLVTVAQAREIILEEEKEKLVNDEQAVDIARERVEEMGIIFIDEIDKVAGRQSSYGADVSREGVQRDILPIVEGAQVNTKHGMIDTSHILFIAAGAFHMSKPSDLIPELQGRFPLRVELDALKEEDFYRILTEPQHALTKQYFELMKTEGVELDFTPEAVRRLSEIAADVNSRTENIGARRLHTMMELLLEEISFECQELSGQTIQITAEYVDQRLSGVVKDQDLSRYIL